jgi:hypothetical protein
MIIDLACGRTKTLAELIEGWAQHVKRLQAELNTNLAENPNAWGGHDYLAALYLRDFVASGLAQSPPRVQCLAQTLVTQADEMFLSFTDRDLGGAVSRFSGEDHDEAAWWWQRIPESGPAHDDLLRAVWAE